MTDLSASATPPGDEPRRTSDILVFVSAVTGSHEGEIAFDDGTNPITLTTGGEIEAQAGNLFIQALQPDGTVPFVWGMMDEGAHENAWEHCQLKPTAVMYKDDRLLLVWALDVPYPREALEPIAQAFDAPLDEPIPTPDTNGWRSVYSNVETFYTLDQLAAAYGAPKGFVVGDRHIDATVRTPFDVLDPRLNEEVVVTFGRSAKDVRWTPERKTRGAVISDFCRHSVAERKDGPAVVFGDMIKGQRKAGAVRAVSFVVLDIDVGVAVEEIRGRIVDSGLMAVVASTHSHMTTETSVSFDAMIKFARHEGMAEEITVSLATAWMRGRGYVEDVVKNVRVAITQRTDGRVVMITHNPIPKWRVIIPLATDFVVAANGATDREGQEKWRALVLSLADTLTLPIDKACLDIARLFYLPAHAEGRPFEIDLFGGDFWDWKTANLTDPLAEAKDGRKGQSKSVTREGQALGRWWHEHGHGFQILEVIRACAPDHLRTDMITKGEIECPFDEDHGNAGSQNDRACVAINAGDGVAESFVIRCQHASCRDKTKLDMLAKMMKDGWFERSVLDEEQYNALAPEDEAPAAEVGAPVTDVAEVTEARATAPVVMTGQALETAIRKALKLGRADEALELNRLKKASGLTVPKFDAIVNSIRAEIKAATKRAPKTDGPREFEYEGGLDHVEAVNAIKACVIGANIGPQGPSPEFTCMQGKPVRLARNLDGQIYFKPMSKENFAGEVAEKIVFKHLQKDGGGWSEFAPAIVTGAVYETCYKILPQTPSIIRVPIFASDGTLIERPGWHKAEGVMLIPDFEIPPVPVIPTSEDVNEARGVLLDVLVDFPFQDPIKDAKEGEPSVSPDPSRAAALAMIIRPFMQNLIGGISPAMMISKPQPDTGATMLARVPLWLFDGGSGTRELTYTDDPVEMRKLLFSAALSGMSHLVFDNVTRFTNPVLHAALTAEAIEDRLLGGNEMASVENRFGWIATGINPEVRADMIRRVCWINLDGPIDTNLDENDKRVFKHPDFPQWVRRERARLVHAILTLIRHWVVTGSKPYVAHKMSSFEAWSQSVGGVLQAAGIKGFLSCPRGAEIDPDEVLLRDFIGQSYKKFSSEPTSPGVLYDHAAIVCPEFLDGVPEVAATKKKFNDRLRQIDKRTFRFKPDGADSFVLRLVKGSDDRDMPVYALVRLPPPHTGTTA